MKFLLLPLVFLTISHYLFSQCVVLQSSTANPLPTGNKYSPGTVVTFCYTIDSFQQVNANFLHGVVLNFGPGWDTSTFTVISLPTGCDLDGVWGFYESCTSTGTGETFGKGFYFDNALGSPTLQLDGDPGNNYGDWGDDCANPSWTFCFSIQVNSDCNGGTDLSATATATGDGTTGSYDMNSCPGIPYAMLSGVTCTGCTLAVTAVATDPLCFGNGGIATAEATNGTPPFTYLWSPGGQTTAGISDLPGGTYSVTVTDSDGCSVSDTITISEPPLLVADAGIDTTICFGLYYPIGGNPTGSGGTPPYHYAWAEIPYVDIANPVIDALISTTYHVTVTDTNGCVQMDSVIIVVDPCIGIDEPDHVAAITIYPNPNDGTFSLITNLKTLSGKSTLIVYDVMGQEMFKKEIVSEKEYINLSFLPKGVYQIVVTSAYGSSKANVIIAE